MWGFWDDTCCMSFSVHLIGWVAAIVSSSIAAPQAIKIYRCPQQTAGVSVWSWVLLLTNAILWLVYAVASKAYPAGVPSLVNGPLAAYIIFRTLSSRGLQEVSTQEGGSPAT